MLKENLGGTDLLVACRHVSTKKSVWRGHDLTQLQLAWKLKDSKVQSLNKWVLEVRLLCLNFQKWFLLKPGGKHRTSGSCKEQSENKEQGFQNI